MVNHNGKIEYSPVIAISIAKNHQIKLIPYPKEGQLSFQNGAYMYGQNYCIYNPLILTPEIFQ